MKKLDSCYYIDEIEKVVAMIKNMRKPLLNSGFIKNTPITSIILTQAVEKKTVNIDLCDHCEATGGYCNDVVFCESFLESMKGKTAKFVGDSNIEFTTDVKTKTLLISCGEKKMVMKYIIESFDDVVLNSDIPVFAQENFDAFPKHIYIMDDECGKEVIGEIFDGAGN